MATTSRKDLNKYVIFDTEMRALRKWVEDITLYNKVFFYTFMEDVVGLKLENYDINARQPISRHEKMKYLANMGLSPYKISKIMKAYVGTVHQVLADDRNVRFYRENPALDSIIEEWQKVRPLFPDEIFIKYLE